MGRPHVKFKLAPIGGKPQREDGILDTGADHTFVSYALAKLAGIDCRRGDTIEQVAIGGGTANMCRRQARISLNDTDCETKLDVLVPATPDDSFGNILGADFMEKTGLAMDLGKSRGTIKCDLTQRDASPPLDHKMRGARLVKPRGTRR